MISRTALSPLTLYSTAIVLTIGLASRSPAIEIVVDYALDEQNQNWFDPSTSTGQARRASVDTAAAFLSAIITNDDWNALPSLNESFTVSDIAASSIRNIDGSILNGTPESDGAGFGYTSSSNNIDTTNRSSVGANEYIVYVGAFDFDSGTTANAKGGWDSSDRRNSAGSAGVEFNTWGGKIYFNTTKTWYTGSNPGLDPTDDYGFQDPNKQPSFDAVGDNWDWSTSSDSWKGFQLRTIDPSANGQRDLYATAIHEFMHSLGATSTPIEDYVGVNSNGDFIGPNLLETFGGPAPGDGGHFAVNTQSIVWGSEDIVSETVLDPNSLAGVRKYLTNGDASLLRDLGYDVLEGFPAPLLAGDYNDDGVVDAADYTVWRLNEGSETTLPNDLTPGMVDLDDYLTWRSGYATSVSTAAGSSLASIPEPAALWLAALTLIYPLLGRRRI